MVEKEIKSNNFRTILDIFRTNPVIFKTNAVTFWTTWGKNVDRNGQKLTEIDRNRQKHSEKYSIVKFSQV